MFSIRGAVLRIEGAFRTECPWENQVCLYDEDAEIANDYDRDVHDDAFEDEPQRGTRHEGTHISEPGLLFRHDQAMEDPRDGLTLFGPLDESKPYGVKADVIGTAAGIKCFARWVEWVQRPEFNTTPLLGRPPFPGFETVFRSSRGETSNSRGS